MIETVRENGSIDYLFISLRFGTFELEQLAVFKETLTSLDIPFEVVEPKSFFGVIVHGLEKIDFTEFRLNGLKNMIKQQNLTREDYNFNLVVRSCYIMGGFTIPPHIQKIIDELGGEIHVGFYLYGED